MMGGKRVSDELAEFDGLAVLVALIVRMVTALMVDGAV